MTSFNAKHPELKEDEVFVTNADNPSYARVGWNTKRKGTTAYTVDGKQIKNSPGFLPVFAQKQELIEAGMRITEDGEIIVPPVRGVTSSSPVIG